MRTELFGLISVILSIAGLYLCANDGDLEKLVHLLNNPDISCVEFSVSSNQSQYPLYIHLQYPIISRIIDDEILSKHYLKEINTIEGFINLIDVYVAQLNKDKPQLSSTVFRQSIRSVLMSLRNVHSSLKSVGLCLKEEFVNSENGHTNHYICKQDLRILKPLQTRKEINRKWYVIYWDPPSCSSLEQSTRFPIRIIYRSQNSSSSSIKIYFEFDLRQYRLNQCEIDLHNCEKESTECIYKLFPNHMPFGTGNYICQCRKGFFLDQSVTNSTAFPVKQMTTEPLSDSTMSQYLKSNCLPCGQGCDACTSNRPCSHDNDNALIRALPLAIQIFCMTLCTVTGAVVFQLRRTRVIKSSNWILLELFLLGAISIYSMIINSYFTPTEFTCAIQPLLREGGFVLMYGVLYVKVYRVLCGFQSRKAQRVYVRDQDIMRYLAVLVVICSGHLIAWVATSFDHKTTKSYTPFSAVNQRTANINDGRVHSCRSKLWDMVSYIYETVLMAVTIYYCKCVKSAPSEYGEVRFITIAVVNELIFSLVAIIARMAVRDRLFLINFLHCHVTTTVSVTALIGPKLWYLYRPPVTSAGRPRPVPHSETHIIQTQQKLNGEVDLVEINLAEMDSETIRDELKRLYSQLEIYKTRVTRKENTHASKKKGGRKQRRFSLQHFHKKHHTLSGHDDEASKISEDSGGNSGGEDANLTATSTK